MTDRFNRSEKSTKHFARSQFPEFFLDEGDGIVDFISTYYDHFSANTGNKIRDLQLQGDIDTTSNNNLIRFNNKYTFGSGRFIKELPAVITGDLRFIIKHIKDLYRSKGTERGVKLFFRLSFNDDPEIFVPGRSLFRPSNSKFNRPNIVELSAGTGRSFQYIASLQGSEIIGSTTGSSAIVRNVFKKKVGTKELIYLDLEEINGEFKTGDKIVKRGASQSEINIAPKVIGPINSIVVEDGSDNLPLGTEFSALPKSDGIELKASVTETEKKLGTFFLRSVEGYGYSNKSVVTVTRAPSESSQADRGKFTVKTNGAFSSHFVSGDLIKTHGHQIIGSANINGIQLNGSGSANLTFGGIEDILSLEQRTYGNIFEIEVNEEPKNYNGVNSPFVAIKDVSFSANLGGDFTVSNTLLESEETNPVFANTIIHTANTLSGNVTITTGNNKVMGTGTNFTGDFDKFDIIKIMNDDGLPTYHNIESISNTTFMTLAQVSSYNFTNNDYGKGFENYIKFVDENGGSTVRVVNNFVNSTAVYLDDKILNGEIATANTYKIRIGYRTANVNFSKLNDPLKATVKEGLFFTGVETGMNADFNFKITSAADSAKTLSVINSGFGYTPGEEVVMRSEDLTPIIDIVDPDRKGTGASAFPVINEGKIQSVIVTNGGSGYGDSPTITISGGTGSGAVLTSTVLGGVITTIDVSNGGSDFFTSKDITVKVIKGGQSILEGRHFSVNSEPNPTIRLQDSNFWQEYSYEIGSTINNDKYEGIVDDLIHMSGRRFFTKNLIKDEATSSLQISEESVTASGT